MAPIFVSEMIQDKRRQSKLMIGINMQSPASMRFCAFLTSIESASCASPVAAAWMSDTEYRCSYTFTEEMILSWTLMEGTRSHKYSRSACNVRLSGAA